jgi:hypothetical protein
MTKFEFLTLMDFPHEWVDFDMYPDELFEKQFNKYGSGNENGTIRIRKDAFQWWIKKKPTREQLIKLVKLASIDPDLLLGKDVIRYIIKEDCFDDEIGKMIETRWPQLGKLTMTKYEFLSLMKYPHEWIDFDMYPDELFEEQFWIYEPGDERGSEHDRNAAFYWWINREPTKEQLIKLVKLVNIDPEWGLVEGVIERIKKAKNFDAEIEKIIEKCDIKYEA